MISDTYGGMDTLKLPEWTNNPQNGQTKLVFTDAQDHTCPPIGKTECTHQRFDIAKRHDAPTLRPHDRNTGMRAPARHPTGDQPA